MSISKEEEEKKEEIRADFEHKSKLWLCSIDIPALLVAAEWKDS